MPGALRSPKRQTPRDVRAVSGEGTPGAPGYVGYASTAVRVARRDA